MAFWDKQTTRLGDDRYEVARLGHDNIEFIQAGGGRHIALYQSPAVGTVSIAIDYMLAWAKKKCLPCIADFNGTVVVADYMSTPETTKQFYDLGLRSAHVAINTFFDIRAGQEMTVSKEPERPSPVATSCEGPGGTR